jgi:hypothetical protein
MGSKIIMVIKANMGQHKHHIHQALMDIMVMKAITDTGDTVI